MTIPSTGTPTIHAARRHYRRSASPAPTTIAELRAACQQQLAATELEVAVLRVKLATFDEIIQLEKPPAGDGSVAGT